MPNVPNYVCTNCGMDKSKQDLTVKKVLFTDMGEGARTLRSRVVSWLCKSCLEEDFDFNREPNVTPKWRDTLV